MAKPKLALYWAASCGGCEIGQLEIGEKILKLAEFADIVFWPVAMDVKYKDVEAMADQSIDVCLFNGGIRSSEQEHLAKLLRAKSKVMIAYGACSYEGGIPGLANLYSKQQILDRVYLETPSTENAEKTLPQTKFKVNEGEMISIVGSNGAGKTALLRTISGLIQPFSGEIIFDGEPIQSLPPHKIVARGIVQVLEARQLFNYLTVEQNLLVGSTIKEARPYRNQNLELVYSLFPRLAERRKQLAGTLSGGEQQMVATARGMMSHPRILMMDEPSWGLAPILTQELFDVIYRIKSEARTTILLVEQNVFKALTLADRAYVIERGHIVMAGKGKELLGKEELKTAYLGL